MKSKKKKLQNEIAKMTYIIGDKALLTLALISVLRRVVQVMV